MIEADGKVFEWESPEKIRADFLETFDFDRSRTIHQNRNPGIHRGLSLQRSARCGSA